jgi:hypothetical protein
MVRPTSTYTTLRDVTRREGRRLDARDQLRTAHELFIGMGAPERAGRELLATGESARTRTV